MRLTSTIAPDCETSSPYTPWTLKLIYENEERRLSHETRRCVRAALPRRPQTARYRSGNCCDFTHLADASPLRAPQYCGRKASATTPSSAARPNERIYGRVGARWDWFGRTSAIAKPTDVRICACRKPSLSGIGETIVNPARSASATLRKIVMPIPMVVITPATATEAVEAIGSQLQVRS